MLGCKASVACASGAHLFIYRLRAGSHLARFSPQPRPKAGIAAQSASMSTPPYHPPVKRSIQIEGHKTSISLEPLFWNMLREAAEEEGVPINALVAAIDAERIQAETPPGLASAIRVWLVSKAG